jgi:hypothetical protein
MQRITMSGLAIVAMLVLGVFAGSAEAHLFLWSGAVPSLLLGRGETIQKFTAVAGGESVECQLDNVHGIIKAKATATQIATGLYSGCKQISGITPSISPFEYEFNANETVSVLKTIIINVPGVCEIEVGPGGNQNLAAVKYLLDPASQDKALLLNVNVSGIHSTIKGALAAVCGGAGGHSGGAYTGNVLIFADAAGTLRWE